MSIFSKPSEEEIKQKQQEQEARHRELSRREADLDQRQAELAAALLHLDEKRTALEARASDLAENSHRVAESRRQIDRALDKLAADQAALITRELLITERELQAEAGFPERLQPLMARLEEKQARYDDRARRLDATEADLLASGEAQKQQAAELWRREEKVALAERERDSDFAERRRVFDLDLAERRRALDLELSARRQELDARAERLEQRAREVASAEAERDRGFAEQRWQLEQSLLGRRADAERELGQWRLERLARMQSEMQSEITQEREQRRADVKQEIDRWLQDFETQRRSAEESLQVAQEKVNKQQASVTAEALGLAQRKQLLDAHEEALQARQRALDTEVATRVQHRERALQAAQSLLDERQAAHEEALDEAVAERKLSFDKQEASLRTELDRLRSRLTSADRSLGTFELLKRQLGGRDAEEVLLELSARENELQDLRERVVSVSPEMQRELARVGGERDKFKAISEEQSVTLKDLQARMRGEDAVRLRLEEEQDLNRSLESRVKALQGQCVFLDEELKRLRSSYERESDREARFRDIEALEPGDARNLERANPNPGLTEIEWLKQIERSCTDYGLRFHPRLLKAFHTALKTAEWSPLTVLAGVSGTGKSELPRLYAHFGGLIFKSLAVQPNWDSQESMLGFFNSIDNKFDAQPVLKLLARSQRPWQEKKRDDQLDPKVLYGLMDHLVLILLDEMNLAHAELYFAEFLSKLESRRGLKGNVPALDIKLGTGLLYQLPLGRNVLWTGTMNQDETTKALSDKVLDRSIVLNFPRPAILERRRELKPLPAATPLLHRRTWESWWVQRSDFTDAEIGPYKALIEKINKALASVGRALGHRVWQSVEYYMANYPETRAARHSGDSASLDRAMRLAFEDQLAQKVMPKLRGIDTRGRSKSGCLDQIHRLLAEKGYTEIVADFELSCECGYGQFIWQTVNFLQEPPVADAPGAGGVEVGAGTGVEARPQ